MAGTSVFKIFPSTGKFTSPEKLDRNKYCSDGKEHKFITVKMSCCDESEFICQRCGKKKK